MPSKYAIIPPVLLLCCGAADSGRVLNQQRQDYQSARQALQEGRTSRFTRLLETLADYPLLPYLLHDYYRGRLRHTEEAELAGFLERYPALAVTGSLRRAWLATLARNRRWQAFLRHYTPQQDLTLRCYRLLAHIETDQVDERLLEEIRAVWLHGESLPEPCDPALELLRSSALMSSDLVWARVQLAMAGDNTRLARYLERWLGARRRTLLGYWLRVHRAPQQGLAAIPWQDTATQRVILLHGIQRLAAQQLSEAIRLWSELRGRYQFSEAQRVQMDRLLAIRAGRRKHPQAASLMAQIPHPVIDDKLLHWRLRIGFARRDWALIRAWTARDPEAPSLRWRSRWWQGRALEQTGQREAARAVYRELAGERDYYGFLAADRLAQDYRMGDNPLPRDAGLDAAVGALPGIRRSYELHVVGEKARAVAEWQHTLSLLDQDQARRAASLAAYWGWHHLAITTLGRISAWDELELRFPVLYREAIIRSAAREGLDPGWVFGLIRAESAFAADIRSPAGAVGLMQVMPATGTSMARKLQLRRFHPRKLKEVETNLLLGSSYLKMMLLRYHGNPVLATAAYNAGPHRVDAWLRGLDQCLAPDVWIEQIPFEETRKYVRRVLFYASVYDWRLGRRAPRMSGRMMMIRGAQAAGAGCSSGGWSGAARHWGAARSAQ